MKQLLAKHFTLLWDLRSGLTSQTKYTDLLHKNTLLGEVKTDIRQHYPSSNYLGEMYGDTFMHTHKQKCIF